VDGVVISRQVDAGQTVAASLNTPTLFTIAQDLREMQVEVAIDESDIGKIRQDQRVTFTVDAFSGRTFDGRVRQIRKAAQTVQNVVTYTVVVETPNPGLLLVPGMTANVRIVADSRENVLKVPNAALRWRPLGAAAAKDEPAPAAGGGSGGGGGADAAARRAKLVADLKLDASQQARLDEISAESRSKFAELREVPEADRRTRGERLRAEVRQKINAMLNADQQRLYAEIVANETGRVVSGSGRVFVVGPDGKPGEVKLRLGLTDGNSTEVVSGDVKEGTDVIEKGYQNACAINDRFEMGFAQEMCSCITYFAGYGDKTITNAQRAINTLEEAEISLGLETAWFMLGAGYYIRGEYEKAINAGEKACKLAKELGQPFLVSWSNISIAITLMTAGDLKRARGLAEEALRIAQECNLKSCEGMARILLGYMVEEMTPAIIVEAQTQIRQGISILEGLKLKLLSANGYLHFGEFLARAGRKEEALDSLKKAESQYLEMEITPESYWLKRTREALARLESTT
jgi:tetratricopeptide (TPR) repeat protein